MRRIRGFTLVELLVVIAIIATLSSLLIPAVGMIQKLMKDVKCGHNLSQVGMAIWALRDDTDLLFPAKIHDLFLPANGLQIKGIESKLLLCPRDVKKGSDPNMGRSPSWTNLSYLHEPGCSWLYEVSGMPLGATEAGWFSYTGYPLPPGPPAPTWADGKKNQQRFGNPKPDGSYGDPFPPDLFPVIRCYFHHTWTPSNYKTTKRVQNLSWNNNVFWSITYWENDVNPLIPIP
ncbi:MAG: type II secretion system protein [Planctomycetes bacterium]|nr:type II secretion system protein [Planctomycetota bacterium]